MDFACTLFLVHLLLCTMYSGGHIPKRSDWWIINIFGTIVMIVLGEYLCSRRELDDIPLLQL
ncbi:MAG: hypothetical protein HC892_09155 [Saprospiraceae bacterium]|nr:hypothetical protein [Saprospiraceae bacterium]